MIRIKIIILASCSLLFSCDTNLSKQKLSMPQAFQEEIEAHNKDSISLLYYHSGECSICFALLKAIQEDFPTLQIISISASSNLVFLNSYMELINFKGTSLFDSSATFINMNSNTLSDYNLFLIDYQYNIILKSRDYGNEIKRDISNYLIKNRSRLAHF